MPGFRELEDALEDAEAAVSAAECHGFLSGQLCTSGEPDQNLWREYVDPRSADDARVEECFRMVSAIMEESRQSIHGDDFGFQLLLPGEDVAMEDRVAALAHWCQGFLGGFGLAAGMPARVLSADVQEWLADLEMIARAEVENPDEEDEIALVQVQEHVRAGVMLVIEELRALVEVRPKEELH